MPTWEENSNALQKQLDDKTKKLQELQDAAAKAAPTAPATSGGKGAIKGATKGKGKGKAKGIPPAPPPPPPVKRQPKTEGGAMFTKLNEAGDATKPAPPAASAKQVIDFRSQIRGFAGGLKKVSTADATKKPGAASKPSLGGALLGIVGQARAARLARAAKPSQDTSNSEWD